MLHFTLIALAISMSSMSMGCGLQNTGSSRARALDMNTKSLEGAYEFISETTVLTKPQNMSERRTSNEWVGVWFFRDGQFSQTLMKKKRNWYPFPPNQQDLAYESSAGTFEVSGKNLLLKQTIALNPLAAGGFLGVEYQLEGDILTLTESIHASREDLSEGQRTIVLRRLKQSN